MMTTKCIPTYGSIFRNFNINNRGVKIGGYKHHYRITGQHSVLALRRSHHQLELVFGYQPSHESPVPSLYWQSYLGKGGESDVANVERV